MKFRPATSDDVDALTTLIQSAYRGDSARRGWTHEAELVDGQRIDRPLLRDILADPGQCMIIADDGGDLVGCVQVSRKAGGLAYFGLLTVAPERQAGGIGSRLIEQAERLAASEYGAVRLEMMVIAQRAELIAYYQRRGYAATGETRPFPFGDSRFGAPRRTDLCFAVLTKELSAPPR
jgi:predicted N-acetyltransferase YhbS